MNRPRLSTIIWRGKWIIAVSIVVGLAMAVLATSRSEKVYESTALLETGVGGQVPARRTFDEQQAAEALARGYATTLDSPGFLARIAPEVAGGSLSAGELGSRVDASLVSETSLVSLKGTGGSPEAARDLVAEVAAAFTEVLRTDARAQMEAQRAELRDRIAALDDEIARGDDSAGSLSDARAGLTSQLADAIASPTTVGIALTSPPDAPTSPVEPRPVLNAVAGILLGALVGIALSWLWLAGAGGAPLRSLRRRPRAARPPDDPSPGRRAPGAEGQDVGEPVEGPVEQVEAAATVAPHGADPGEEDEVGRAYDAIYADAEKDEAAGAHHPQADGGGAIDEPSPGSTPHLGSAPVGAEADDEEAEAAYDAIFAELVARAGEGASLVLALLAEQELDGREDVSQGIARAAARAGRNVLLADGDVRGRRLSAVLNHGRSRGLGDLITGVSQTRPRVVRLPRNSSYAFMPAGRRPPDARPFWGDEQFRTAVGRLAAKRSLVLIESPAAAVSESGARAVVGASTGIVLVASTSDTHATELLGRVLGERGRAQVLGVVTTMAAVAESTGSDTSNGSIPTHPREEHAGTAPRS